MSDQIAIVGIGCRFPGADNAAEFWKVLVNGENHVRNVDDNNRLNLKDVYDPDKNAKGKTYVNKAGLLKDIDGWDNHLFGVSDEEASVVDPQQRLVLECCHMAMEDAGITRKRLDGSNTSVYIGAMNDDFGGITETSTVDSGYVVTGLYRSILSARVSYVYNLKGPCMVVDTACSSSLVAIHLGCQSLRLQESDMCFAGGVSVLLDPLSFVALSKARMLSPSGQCHAFTSDADGYARGEGCGVVILQRLDDALAEGNTIWGVIHTGTNQDGHMITPMTAPSGAQQLELLERVYLGRDRDKNAIQVIEAHGTGTPLGDPTEVNALGAFFKDTDAARESKIKIGSLKTNIGHLESAAGVAGIIKVLLMMKNETVVQSLMYSEENRNPKLDFKGYNLLVPTENLNWPVGHDTTRHACVNSFGFGGSNAHIYVQQYKPVEPKHQNNETNGHPSLTQLVSFSNLYKKGLVHNLKSFVEDLNATKADLTELSMTSLCRRDHYKYRVAVSASSKEELKQRCNQTIQRIEKMRFYDRPRLVFVFCGVGTTWKGMCVELLQNQVFLSEVKLADEALKRYTGWSIIQKWRETADVLDPFLGHISIFVCQLGISAIWEKIGIQPDIVLGQSVGEVAACFIAGLIDLETAVRIIYHRSLLLSQSPKGGMMVVRNADILEIEEMCKEIGSINIAVFISPKSCTVSGNKDGILTLEKRLKSRAGVRVKILDVTSGYHSHLVREAGVELENTMAGNFKAGTKAKRTPIISTVYGKAVEENDIRTESYWNSNVTEPVQFHDAVFEARGKHENTVFIEIGPSPVLKAHISDIFGKDTDCISIPSVEKGKEHSTLMLAIGTLFERGGNPDLTLLFDHFNEIKPSPIPRYIFNKKSFPVRKGTKPSTDVGFRKYGIAEHNYISSKDGTDLLNFMEIKVSPETTPYVYEHIVGNRVIIPGALFADVGFEAGKRLLDLPCDKLSVQLDLLNAVPIQDEDEVKLDLRVERARNDHVEIYKFGIIWKNTVICKGVVKEKKMFETHPYIKKYFLVQHLSNTLTSSEIYEWLSESGFRYGKRLKVLGDGASNTDRDRCLIDIHIPDEIIHEIPHSDIHPALLDGMLQSTVILARDKMRMDGSSTARSQMMPVGMDSITVTPYMADIVSGNFSVQIFTEQISYSEFETMEKSHFNVYLIDTYGLVFAQIENLVLYAGRGAGHLKCCDDLRLGMVWQKIPDPLSGQPDLKPIGKILVLNANEDLENAFLSNHEMDTVEFDKADSRSDFTSPKYSNLLSGRSHVIVFIDPNTAKDPLNAETTMEVVTNNLQLIQHLIMTLKSAPEQTTELTIVTLAVHASHYPKGYMNQTSLIGSEMWGFFRNIELEFIYQKTTLVDIAYCNQPTTKSLLCLISTLQQDNGQTGREYCIYNTTLMEIEVHSSTKRHITRPCRNNVTGQEIVVCSSNQQSISTKDWTGAITKEDNVLRTPLETIPMVRIADSYPNAVKVTKKMLFDKMATYIVVGGLTGVGWFIVEVLAEMGAGVVVTLGRRNVAEDVEILEKLEMLRVRNACSIEHIQADVTVRTELKESIHNIENMFPKNPIKGIFQGAGVIESISLEAMTKAQFQKVLRPKIQGTLNLHNETKHLQLDYFVLLSSISSIMGTQAQSNYGAANSFLDAFANFRRQLGLNCQSINWGGIAIGMAAIPKVSKELEQRGHILMKKEEFRSCFVHCLLTDETNVVYAHLDTNILRKNYNNRAMLAAGKKLKFLWENNFLNDDHASAVDIRQFNMDSYLMVGLEEQIEMVQSLLKGVLASVLAGENFEDIEIADSLVDLGMDSISSLTVSNLIRNYFGVDVNSDIMFDPETTIQSLSLEITKELGGRKILQGRKP